MKKFLIGLLVLSMFAFSGCDMPFVDDEAKDEQIEDLSDKIDDLQDQLDAEKAADDEAEADDEKADEEEKTEEEDKVAVDDTDDTDEPVKEAYTGASYITLNSPANETSFHEEPIVFKGIVSPDTTKIVVTWTHEAFGQTSEDVYKLQNFKYEDTTFKYSAKGSYDNLRQGTNNYEFKAYFDDGDVKTANVQIFYTVGGAEMGKPVIYLYPEETMEVSVNVVPQGGISISDPEIGEGWNVIANPNGEIFNLGDSEIYPYLFWEGFATTFVRPDEGFVVAQEGVSAFFDDKLAVLGLNGTEIADFKEFWVPRLAADPYYFITFVPQTEFDGYAPLTVVPTPDTVIRVFFDYQGLSEEVKVVEQQLEARERDGFSVIEWGGRLY